MLSLILLASLFPSQAIPSGDDRLKVRQGLELWLDAHRIDSKSGSLEPVSNWQDLSGRRHDLEQSKTDFQPRRILASDGLYVRFDGVDDFLRRSKTGVRAKETTIY